MAVNFKDEVLLRVYIIFAVIVVPVALLLVYRTFEIAVFDQDKYQELGKAYVRDVTLQAERGNIYSQDDNLLATSVPYFSLRFDPFMAGPKDYYGNIDSLAYLISLHIDPSHTAGDWRDSLVYMRDSMVNGANHYYRLSESVSYRDLQFIQTFPLFNLGRLGGGLIVENREERKRPFGWLARRTVGKLGTEKVGLEEAFDEQLAGKKGQARMFRIPNGGGWLPLEDLTVVEPTAGADVHSTINVNIQDITENALFKAARRHLPDWGTAIVMDVETGAIRAIANLGKGNNTSNKYYENYNYAIAKSTEPGSTFKLATMMALLEDGKVTLEDEIDIERGEKTFYDKTIKDSNPLSKNWNTISIRQAFEQSSNVAMAKLADSLYRGNEFSERLQDFHLAEKTGLEITGEAEPFIADTTSEFWSGISRAWLAFGYESRLTPLQTLTFFNSVANNGRYMKPYLVEELRREGKSVERFKPTVVEENIASQTTIEQLQSLLEGVVDRGTARKLKSDQYRFAGKTGTSQQNYGKRGKKKYQASFAGYFPAENPKYSIIVVIFNPSQGAYYGGEVAGPVFREIADNIYNSMIEVHEPLNQGPRPVLYASQLPDKDVGFTTEIETILRYVNVSTDSITQTEMAEVRSSDERVSLQATRPGNPVYPDVRGMRLRDAIYVLENAGHVVQPKGVGRVTKQVWQSDVGSGKGKNVTLVLN
ncbi:penicillin-binding transpeptidase domain-containing protein [Neolewinella antarctica]|uniref:Cell division protein FtsI (Penicillin-binding protein 3) n=1 Tax=Neolewinella antarctica TaxID=442734 RepID=A0ABX0X7U1_9BACT|nr:penicillin-binding transpeptidase domain-containing protein [Neolewinella antarctica]NJC25287.1 cell division protein FtsI (penicillin-binding protein 3) [Neolewinella antarctica]